MCQPLNQSSQFWRTINTGKVERAIVAKGTDQVVMGDLIRVQQTSLSSEFTASVSENVWIFLNEKLDFISERKCALSNVKHI